VVGAVLAAVCLPAACSSLCRSGCKLVASLVSMAEGVEVRRAASSLRILLRHFGFVGCGGVPWCRVCHRGWSRDLKFTE
jgi:hypothetical protein